MATNPWYRSRTILLAAAVALPPAGLALLWARRGTGVFAKLLGSVAIAGIGITELVLLFGLRAEMDGSGISPIVSFYKPDSHYAELERDRARPRPVRAKTLEEVEVVKRLVDVRPAAETGSAYWTDFRGPQRDGRYEEAPIRTDWPPEGLPLAWRQPVGGGYASFVVAEGSAFTIEQRRGQEVVAAYDLETGRQRWTNSWDAEFREAMGGNGPRATPTWHQGRVYALGALGEFRCLDAKTGKVLWSKNILTDNGAANVQWGMSASPLIVDEKVIVLPGGPGGRSVVAYHKVTGERVWSAQDDQQAYTSPMVATLAGRRQLVVVSARRAMGLAVEDGALLWEHPWVTEYNVNSAQPLIVGESRVFISAGYGHGGTMLEVTRDGAGFAARVVWANTSMKAKFNGPVLHEGYIYGLDEGILACVDAATGERKWKGGRYGYGQVLLASGHLVIQAEDGDLALVKATPQQHLEVARFPAIEGKTWNNPALAGGRLLVRNTTEMACFRVGKQSEVRSGKSE